MAHDAGTEAALWGVAAEFATPAGLAAAARALRAAQLGRVDCFTPVPLPELGEALGLRPGPVPLAAICGAGAGFAAMMGMCLYATVFSYRFNIGGRPLVSWPAYVVPSVSFACLVGALAALLVMLFLNRLPRLNHPAFSIPDFSRATADRFFLAVETQGEALDPEAVERHLARLAEAPLATHRVAR